MFDVYDSPAIYYFSDKNKAKAFKRRYKGRYPWRIVSYPINLKRVPKIDQLFFPDTPGGRAFLEIQAKELCKKKDYYQ
jgi:hypothetical protein